MGAPFHVGAFDSHVPVSLALVASNWFTHIFEGPDKVASYVYVVCEQVVGSVWGRKGNPEVGYGLVSHAFVSRFDPVEVGDVASVKIVVMCKGGEVVWVGWVEGAIAGYKFEDDAVVSGLDAGFVAKERGEDVVLVE